MSEDMRRRFAPPPKRTLDLSKFDASRLLGDLTDDEWEPDLIHATTAPLVDLWSLTAGPILVGRGEDGGIVVLDVERISSDREHAMTSEGVVALGRRAPLPLERESRQ